MRKYARHVYAYEPHPELADRLARLLPDVTVRCAAVSDSTGTLTLRVPIWDGRSTHELGSVVIDYRRWTKVHEYNVPAIRVDDEDMNDIGFIKIDVEQHEVSVLQGAMGKIRGCRPSILSEANALIYPKELPDMFDFVTKESYKGFFKFHNNYLPFAQFCAATHANRENFGKSDFVYNNVFFLPEEKDASFLVRRGRWSSAVRSGSA